MPWIAFECLWVHLIASLIRYILTESSRYCPNEDFGGYGARAFDWQNPFTAYNCTWGFVSPAPFPLDEGQCAVTEHVSSSGGSGARGQIPVDTREVSTGMLERENSTTCPRQVSATRIPPEFPLVP